MKGFSRLVLGLFLLVPLLSAHDGFAQQSIRVGVLHSLSGPVAPEEIRLKDAMLLLIDQQNRRGGVLGKRIEAIVSDPGSDWPQYAEKARELIDVQKVAAVFGGWTSLSRKSMLGVFESRNSILFYPAPFEGQESSQNVFYTGATPNQLALPTIDYLLENGTKRWIFNASDYAYPRTAGKIIEGYLKAKGVPAGDISISYKPIGSQDWASQVAAIRKFASAGGKTAMLSLLDQSANIALSNELLNQNVGPAVVQVVSLALGEENLAKTDPKPFVGQLTTRNYFQSVDSPLNRAFIADWASFAPQWRGVVDAAIEAHYVGFNMWVKAVQSVGTTDPAKVIPALVGISVPNLSGGESTMMPNHYTSKSVFVGKVEEGGRISVVWKGRTLPQERSAFNNEGDVVADWRPVSNCKYDAKAGICRKENPQMLDLLYATTRGVLEAEGKIATDDTRNGLTFGMVQVRVPKGHEFGKVERPSYFARLISYVIDLDREPYFELRGSQKLSHDDFVGTVKASKTTDAMVFVHGFKNTFEESAFRLAQIVWDTQYRGVPVLFSWPSRGGVEDYVSDYDSAEFSSDAFAELLRTLAEDANLKTIHVIAHSMGNRVVMGGLASWRSARTPKPVKELILAAPDVDADIFRRQAVSILDRASGVTLYASANDKALLASKFIRGDFVRAGDIDAVKGPVIVKGIDTIDVSAIGDELFGLNHNVFSNQPTVVNEMALLMAEGKRPPHARTPILRRVPENKPDPDYWRYP